jgi:diguanylate cyclase
MCDLDYFKKINDSYGHLAGDKVLVEFVNVIKENIRNSDIVIRYGGEEFIIMLPAVGKERGYHILSCIAETLANRTIGFEDKSINVTVSMGITNITPQEYYNKNMLEYYLSVVDRKLYNAKNAGRNQICI